MTNGVRVIHIGQSSLIVSSSTSDLCFITTPARGLVPHGMQIPAQLFKAISFLVEKGLTNEAMDRLGRASLDAEVQDLHLGESTHRAGTSHKAALDSVLETWMRVHNHDMESRRLLWNAGAFSISIAHPRRSRIDQNQAVDHLLALVGAGPGATPTGDDILTGFLAARSMSELSIPSGLEEALLEALNRTTSVSAHQIECALQGEFASIFLEICEMVAEGEATSEVVRAAGEIGHSSGIDFVLGLYLHLHHLSRVSRPVFVPRA